MSQQGSSSDEYEKAILWVPDPTSPAGWIRRKVWPQEDLSRPRPKRPMGFGFQPRRERED